jgi:hypothetical protein
MLNFCVLWQPFWKWRSVEICQCRESIRDIIIYPHIKFWWYRTKPSIASLMVNYHYVKFYVSIIIHLEVININVRNCTFPIGFYSNLHPLWTPQNMTLTPFTTKLSSSSWDLPWTCSCATERKENNNNNEVWLCLGANTEVPKRLPYQNSGMWMQPSSLPTNFSLQNTPRYQFSLKSEIIDNLTILLVAILKMVAS